MQPQECGAFAPGSIGNLACGFDVMGLALAEIGDVVVARRAHRSGVRTLTILGDGGRLPTDFRLNAAGAAAEAVLARAAAPVGIELELRKGLPLAAGMGGSAASAVAAVVAVDALLETRLASEDLLECALAGEEVASGAGHPDNAAPSLFGGLVLVPAWDPLRIIPLEVPPELFSVHVHPHMEVETAAARKILGGTVALSHAVAQWGNTAALVAGLFRGDWEIISQALEDRVAEPLRAGAVPGFQAVKKAALDAGALGASLSGSGPSLFALCRGRERAEAVGKSMVRAFREAGHLDADLLVSPGRSPGARLLLDGEDPLRPGASGTVPA
jgi:homoserine kinase